ncbi:MAG: M20/M25/M40 family metallo-hydrolase [Myxococcaceae bacterium]
MLTSLLLLQLSAAPDAVYAEIPKRHAEAIARLQKWIATPSIAAESLNSEQGAELMIALLKDAGFQKAEKVPTDGKPAVFATYDAGAAKTVGLYFMYDVKQFDPKEWSSPPLEAKLVDKPGFGKVIMGRGAVNQKGPESALLAALHAIKGAKQKLPVNLVLIAEGEEEIGSPHLMQAMKKPEVQAAFSKCAGVFMPSAAQDPDGSVSVSLGAKGVVELELVATGEAWGKGASKDIHSGNRARVDSPSFHLVQALNTLVNADGDVAIDGFNEKVKPLSAETLKLIDDTSKHESEEVAKKELGVTHWAHDANWHDSLVAFAGRPTVNIEGLVAGYTGTGGKTVLPHKAVAKLDLRLVPDLTYDSAIAMLKAHLAKRGFGDIAVNVSGGYDPTTTPLTAPLLQKQLAVYKAAGYDALPWPRNGGSYPGYVFTNAPLKLAAGHFGLGHGGGAHAPDEYYVIEPSNPKVKGYDDAVKSFVDYLYELAK